MGMDLTLAMQGRIGSLVGPRANAALSVGL